MKPELDDNMTIGEARKFLNATKLCIECKEPVGELFMVTKDVWQIEAKLPFKGSLHWACLESRIGRKLVKSDLTPAKCNTAYMLLLSCIETLQ